MYNLFDPLDPVIVIPSTYFIDLNGVAIEIIGGSIENQSLLLEKINKTIDVFKQNFPEIDSNNLNRTEDNQQQSNTASPDFSPDVKKECSPKPEASGSTSAVNQSSVTDASEPQNNSESPSIDEKVERANQLIEAIRQKKAKEEEEKERANEIERRKGMKEMQKAKRLREDKEAQEVVQERQREKREEQIAKERVLAQIAADREERRARQMVFSQSASNEKTNTTGEDIKKTELRQRVHDKARIQFRLPDGSTHTHVFEANDLLEKVAQFVSSNLNIRSFVLSTTFPRKEFLQQEYSRTLEDLSLAPTSVLLVITRSDAISSGSVVSASIFWQIFTYISLPFVMIWSAVMSVLGRSDASRGEDHNQQTSNRSTQRAQKRGFYNRDGNIARMRDPNDDDDDNNTWNGNSTQQM